MIRRFLMLGCVISITSACNEGGLVTAPVDDACDEPEGAAESEAIHAAPVSRVPREVPAHSIAPQMAMLPGEDTASNLVRAMGADPESAVSLTYVGHPNANAIFDDLGALEPMEGNSFAWLSTGLAGAGTDSAVAEDYGYGTQTGTDFGLGGCTGAETFDCVQLRYRFVVPEGMHSVRFRFNFLSTEYPEYIDSGYNDTFLVSLESASHNYDNISFDSLGNPIGIDSALFDEPCENLEGTGFDLDDLGFCDAGATGVLATQAPVEPGEEVTLTFILNDAGDGIYDSAVQIDDLQASASSIEDPETDPCD